MVGAEHRAERMGTRRGAGNALLVKIVAENIDAVGAREVVKNVAVDICDGNPGRGFDEGACAEILLHQTAILERHPIGSRELQVGDPRRGLRRHRAAFGVAFLIEAGEPEEAILALRGDGRRRAVGTEEIVDIEFVEWDQPRDRARHLRMSGQRAVLGARQRQSRVQFREGRGGSRRGGGEGENQNGRIHAKQR